MYDPDTLTMVLDLIQEASRDQRGNIPKDQFALGYQTAIVEILRKLEGTIDMALEVEAARRAE